MIIDYHGVSILDGGHTRFYYTENKIVPKELTLTLKGHPVIYPQLLDFLFLYYIMDTYYSVDFVVDMNKAELTEKQLLFLYSYREALNNKKFTPKAGCVENVYVCPKIDEQNKKVGKQGLLWSGGKDSYYMMLQFPKLPTYRVCPSNAEYFFGNPLGHIGATADHTLHITGLDFSFCGLDNATSFMFSVAYPYLIACGIELNIGFTYEDLAVYEQGQVSTLTTSRYWIKKFEEACGMKIHLPIAKVPTWKIITKLEDDELDYLSCKFGSFCGKCETCYLIARIREEQKLGVPILTSPALDNGTWQKEWNKSAKNARYYYKNSPFFSIAVRKYLEDNA